MSIRHRENVTYTQRVELKEQFGMEMKDNRKVDTLNKKISLEDN